MEGFLDNLSKSVEASILTSLTGKLNEFATLLIELPEMKAKGVTKEQVLDCWNSVSEFKVAAGDMVSVGPVSSGDKKPRAKTDRDHKCGVLKTRGDNAGQPCGKNCVVDTDFCPEHLKKNQKVDDSKGSTIPTMTTSAAPSVSAAASTGTCQHVLQTGKNKGNACTAKAKEGKWCTTHAKKH